MFSSRFLKIINLSIAVLLVVVAGVVWWFAGRPLPQTSGTISAPLSAKATVAFDAIGVPHIEAASWEDAIFVQGFLTAQERMWQMDALRRLAAGELSEVVGKVALEVDQEARRLRLKRIAEMHERNLSNEDRAVLAAYARGVNHYLETNRGKLPMEFAVLAYDPRPWSVRDTILAGLEMYRQLTTTWKDDLLKTTMLDAGEPEKVDFLFPARLGREPAPGSNNWVLAGPRTTTGKPILANDTHLDFAFPSTWYMVHLKAPGLNVTGFSLPGVPCVIIGHNDRIGWGMTNLMTDVQDLYLERLDPRTGRYQYQGQLEQARAETDVLAVKGESPRTLITWITRHGPVVANESNRSFALRWAAAEPGYAFPFLDLNRARDWKEFRAAAARFPGPGQNFVYADVDGNIGYQATGRLPLRRNFTGDTAVDGASGQFEWEGFIPFEDLPSLYNPPSHRIVTANQNLFPKDYPHPVNGSFEPPYRAQQINARLRSQDKWSAPEMLGIQKDVYSPFLHWLSQAIVKAYGDRQNADRKVSEAVEVLRDWNGQAEKGTAAPMVAYLTQLKVQEAMAERAAPGKGKLYRFLLAPAVVEKLFTERPEGWFLNFDQVLVQALIDGVNEGAKLQGSSPKRWDWGQYNALQLGQPVLSQLPLVSRYFQIRAPMSGSSTTVKQTTRRLGPSQRMVLDFANLDQSLANITIGQSGHRLSSHYKDQWEAYWSGSSFPMQFNRIDAKSTLVFEAAK